jgi:hypothetical protein
MVDVAINIFPIAQTVRVLKEITLAEIEAEWVSGDFRGRKKE